MIIAIHVFRPEVEMVVGTGLWQLCIGLGLDMEISSGIFTYSWEHYEDEAKLRG